MKYLQYKIEDAILPVKSNILIQANIKSLGCICFYGLSPTEAPIKDYVVAVWHLKERN